MPPLKTCQVIEALGISHHTLMGVLRSGKMPRPAKDACGNFDWTPKDIENACRALAVDRRRKKEAITP
jgi:hypothetical protein